MARVAGTYTARIAELNACVLRLNRASDGHRAHIGELEVENRQLRDIGDRLAADCAAWEKRIERTETKVERLRMALTSARDWMIGAKDDASALRSRISRVLDDLSAALESKP